MAAVASDAATMLAEALQQMDGLISDDQLIMESLKSQTYSSSSEDKVLSLVEELRGKLENMTREAKLTIEVPGSTIDFLIGWLNSLQNVTILHRWGDLPFVLSCRFWNKLSWSRL